MRPQQSIVTPAKAGGQSLPRRRPGANAVTLVFWIPACAGMTIKLGKFIESYSDRYGGR